MLHTKQKRPGCKWILFVAVLACGSLVVQADEIVLNDGSKRNGYVVKEIVDSTVTIEKILGGATLSEEIPFAKIKLIRFSHGQTIREFDTAKAELSRTRNQLKEKDREIQRLKTALARTGGYHRGKRTPSKFPKTFKTMTYDQVMKGLASLFEMKEGIPSSKERIDQVNEAGRKLVGNWEKKEYPKYTKTYEGSCKIGREFIASITMLPRRGDDKNDLATVSMWLTWPSPHADQSLAILVKFAKNAVPEWKGIDNWLLTELKKMTISREGIPERQIRKGNKEITLEWAKFANNLSLEVKLIK